MYTIKWAAMFAMLLFCMTALGLGAQTGGVTAEQIVDGSRNRIGASTITSRSRMTLTDKKGAVSERLIDQFSKDGASGGNRTLIVFQRPASVAGTRFLTVDNKSGGSDKWIFLPSFGKVRRIAASEGSGSFMGTDLSYDDIASTDRETALDTHTLLREETLDGKAVYVIESIPKAKDYQYTKMIQWIGKADKIAYKLELYNKRGVLYKTMEVLSVKNIQGYDTPVKSRMTTVTAGTSTTIDVDTIIYDDAIPEGVFSQGYLETGRF